MRVLEVLVKKNLGSERLFQHYIYMQIERRVLQFTVPQYCRLIRALADKGHSSDRQFWHQFVLRYVFVMEKPKNAVRQFGRHQAKAVWDSLIYLKLKNPEIDVAEALAVVE